MKKFTLFIAILFVCAIVSAQAPQGFKYQAVARDASGNVLANKSVAFRISIFSGSESGSVVYSEVHQCTTNGYGLVDFVIGEGSSKSGIFSTIGWSANSYFVKVELDPAGGTAYQTMGTSQLLSVPYALHAKTVEEDNVNDADADPTNEIQVLSLSGSSLTLSNGGGTVTLPSSSTGDNWGSQSVVTDATLTGSGLTATPLKLAQQSATTGQGLKWNGTTWKPGNVDPDSTNEIQTLSLSGSNLTLSDGGGTVTLPTADGFSLPYDVSGVYSSTPFSIENSGSSYYTIAGLSTNGYGIYGKTSANNGAGVLGLGTGSDYSTGVIGRTGEGTTTTLPGNCGVLGQANANIGVAGTAVSGIGGYFYSGSGLALKTSGAVQLTGISEGAGKVLTSDASGNATWETISTGLSLPYSSTVSYSSAAFEVTNSNSSAIYGVCSSSSSSGIGVKGESSSTNGYGIWGANTASSGTNYGIYGTASSSASIGVYGSSPYIGIQAVGTGTTSYGVYGSANYVGIEGYVTPSSGSTYGVVGISSSTSGTGVYGSCNASSGTNYGVHGISSSSSGIGVFGESNNIGVEGTSSDDNGTGVKGSATKIGVMGNATGTSGTNYGLYATSSSTYGFGVYAMSPYVGIYSYCSGSSGWAGYFSGKVGITGSLGIGTAYPDYPLEVAGSANLNYNTTGVALRCNGSEAIWFNGTYFSWGYGGTYNYFGDKVFIGATASDPGSYLLVVNGTAAKTGGGSWSTYSDKRLKDIHGDYTKGLNEIIQLQPVNYSYKKDNAKGLISDKTYAGFIAQDVQTVFPEAVTEEPDGYLSLDESPINVAVINALKELKAENDKLKAENQELKNDIDLIKERLSKLEK